MGNLANFSQVLSSEPELREILIKILGAGAGNPGKVFGNGVTVTWLSTGLYQVVWGENPGLNVGYTAEFEATAPAALKGYTVVAAPYSNAGGVYSQQFSVYNSAFALADLAAAQWMTVICRFKATAVS